MSSNKIEITNTGYKKIDSEHLGLVELIYQIEYQIVGDDDNDNLKASFNLFFKRVAEHCESEKYVFEETELPYSVIEKYIKKQQTFLTASRGLFDEANSSTGKERTIKYRDLWNKIEKWVIEQVTVEAAIFQLFKKGN